MARLDEAITISGMRLRNRLVLPPITTFYGTPKGEVTEEVLGFYRQRSIDMGMVIVEATAVRADGRIGPRSLGLWSKEQTSGMARLARTIQAQGAAAVVQLNHAGAKAVYMGEGLRAASPSSVPFQANLEPMVLSRGQIEDLVEDFGRAAARAAEAGFDGVEVHGAHFYLLSQFLSPLTNRREDRYGGDAAGRATFAIEAVQEIRSRVGKGYPIVFRLNAIELLEGGQTVGEAIVAARLLETAGVNAIHSSLIARGGWKETESQRLLQGSSALPKEQPWGAAVQYAAQIKKAVEIPVIAVGKLGDPEKAAETVEEGLVDLVAIGRQMIVDPDTSTKILTGRGGEILQCRECLSCFASIGKGLPVVCSTNRNLAGKPLYGAAPAS